jgi:hypothetical protein
MALDGPLAVTQKCKTSSNNRSIRDQNTSAEFVAIRNHDALVHARNGTGIAQQQGLERTATATESTMSKTNTIRWLSCVCVTLGFMASSLTAAAKTKISRWQRTTTHNVIKATSMTRFRVKLLKPAVLRVKRGRSTAGFKAYGGRDRGYFNPKLEAARGHAPGTVGHAQAVGRAGFYPDSIGLELQAGYRRGTIGYSRYWSNPSQGRDNRGGRTRSW